MTGAKEKTAPRRLVDKWDHQLGQLFAPPEGIGLGQKTGHAQPRLLGVVKRAVENKLGAAGQSQLGFEVIKAHIHRQGGRGKDPGHLGPQHLGAKPLGHRQRGDIEGKMKPRAVIPVGETSLVNGQHLPQTGAQFADPLEGMIQLLSTPQRQFKHLVTEPEGIIEAGQCLGPERMAQHVAGIAAPAIHPEGETQVLTGDGEPVRRLAKLPHVMRLGPIGQLNILRQILDGATAHRLAEVVGGDLRQLVRLVEHIHLCFGHQLTKSRVFHRHIGEEEVMIDHHHLGIHGAATGHHQMAVVVIGTISAEAVVVGAGDVGEDLGVLLQSRNIPHIAIVGGGRPGFDLHQIIEDVRLLQMGFAQEPVHPLYAQIVAAPLEQGHWRGVGERACDGREIPVEELLLQVLGSGADHHPLAGFQRWHQIGVGLAGARARLHQQAAATLDGAGDSLGHGQLRGAGNKAIDVAGQRAIWLEQGLDGQRGVPLQKRALCQKRGESGTDNAFRRRDRSDGRGPACDHPLQPLADHAWHRDRLAGVAGIRRCPYWSCATGVSC